MTGSALMASGYSSPAICYWLTYTYPVCPSQALAHGVVDAKFTIVHLLIKYCSSMFFTFMMTMSDSSGQSLMTSVFVLSGFMALFDMN